MKKSLILISLIAVSLIAAARPAQAQGQENNTVTISAKGDDVRSIIHSIFEQSKKNYVLAPGVRFVMYLSVDKIDFDEALAIVCQQANLKYEIQNGIYYIKNAPRPVVEDKPKTEAPKTTPKVDAKPVQVIEEPKGKLPQTVLSKRVTTRLQKADIRSVFGAFSQQTAVKIEIDKSVPDYKLDAFLINTSLKYALDQITQATKLSYRFTDKLTILIFKPEELTRAGTNER